MQIPLDHLIEHVLEELKKLCMAESTIKSYACSAYSPIQNYCARNGTAFYEPILLNSFLRSQKERLENSEISKRHFRRLRRAVLMVHDLYQHGKLQGCRYDPGSIYKTNDYFCLCLKQFLDAQHLSRGTIVSVKKTGTCTLR